MDMRVLDQIFKNEAITDKYIFACDCLLEAFRMRGDEYESSYWEKAGFAFLKTDKKDWGYHFIRFAQALDNHTNRIASDSKSTKKLKIFKEPSKLKRLLKGWI